MFLAKLGKKPKKRRTKMRRKLGGLLIIVLIIGLGCRGESPVPADPSTDDFVLEVEKFVATNCGDKINTEFADACGQFLFGAATADAILCAGITLSVAAICAVVAFVANVPDAEIALAPALGICALIDIAVGAVCLTIGEGIVLLAKLGCCLEGLIENATKPKPIVVSITEPADKSTFVTADKIPFAGTAKDPDGTDLTDSLVWKSDRDGQIGTGGNFTAILKSGVHIITATATNKAGATGESTVNITVE